MSFALAPKDSFTVIEPISPIPLLSTSSINLTTNSPIPQMVTLSYNNLGDPSEIYPKQNYPNQSFSDQNILYPQYTVAAIPKYSNAKKTYLKYTPYLLIIHSESPSKDYEKLNNNAASREDNNLRLFAAELNFLNLKYNPSKGKKSILVYIGSSQGDHLIKLISLYPELEYHCYDPILSELLENFVLQLRTTKVVLFNKLFDDEDTNQYINIEADVYVITDFTNPNIKSDLEIKHSTNVSELRDEKEFYLAQDMESQMRWVKLMKPKSSCLKIRFPHFYKNKTTNITVDYLQGLIYATIFSPRKTSECRMIVDEYESSATWNFKRLDEQMYYYNDVIRETPVVNPMTGFSKYGNGFDLTVFFWILKDYLIIRGHALPLADELINLYKFITGENIYETGI